MLHSNYYYLDNLIIEANTIIQMRNCCFKLYLKIPLIGYSLDNSMIIFKQPKK